MSGAFSIPHPFANDQEEALPLAPLYINQFQITDNSALDFKNAYPFEGKRKEVRKVIIWVQTCGANDRYL